MQDIIPRQGDAIGVARVPTNRRTAREVARAVDREHGRGIVAAARVDAAAHVTRTALMHTAMLSREEEQLIRLAPLAEPRMRAIVDVYAIYAAGVVGEL